MYLTYRDYPQLPVELLPEVYKSIEIFPDLTPHFRAYSFHYTTQPIRDWFANNIVPILITPISDPSKELHIQVIQGNTGIHKDYGRAIALSYIIETGGDQITTNIYDDEYNLIESNVIMPHRWHELIVDVFHRVIGEPTKRIALTINLKPNQYKF